MTQSSVSRLVAGAMSAGLVHRELDSSDRRRGYLHLTQVGAARLDAVFHDLGPERVKLAAALETQLRGRARHVNFAVT